MSLEYLFEYGHTVCSFMISSSKSTVPGRAAVTRSWEILSNSWRHKKSYLKQLIEFNDIKKLEVELKLTVNSNGEEHYIVLLLGKYRRFPETSQQPTPIQWGDPTPSSSLAMNGYQ